MTNEPDNQFPDERENEQPDETPLAGQTILEDFAADTPVASSWEERPIELQRPNDPWLMPIPPAPTAPAPPVTPPVVPVYAATRAGRMPPVAAPTDLPLPPYSDAAPTDTLSPRMITAALPLSAADITAVGSETRLRWWPAVVSAAFLMVILSLEEIQYAAQASIPHGLSVQIVCLLGTLLFAVAAIFRLRGDRRRRQQKILAAAAAQTPGVIEVYDDRVVHITPRTRTVVPLRQPDAVIIETPRTLTVADGHGAVTWSADALTPPALENLRRLLYPAFRQEQRRSGGRLMAAADVLPSLPEIAMTPDDMTRFTTETDGREESDRRFRRALIAGLPFTAAAAMVIGGGYSALYPLLPSWLDPAVCSLAVWAVLFGATAVIAWIFLHCGRPASATVEVALTPAGAAVEEHGNLRFFPREQIRSIADENNLTLQLPEETLRVSWERVPDLAAARRWLQG